MAETLALIMMSSSETSQSSVSWWSIIHLGTFSGNSIPTCDGDAASTIIIPDSDAGQFE